MEVTLHRAAETFLAATGPVLAADPVRHTTALTALDRVRRGLDEATLLLTVADRGAVVGAAVRVGRRAVAVSALPPALATVAERAAAADPEAVAVFGPVPAATAWAGAAAARTGAELRVRMRMRLFRLGALRAPAGVPGTAREATDADGALLAAWTAAFTAEAVATLAGDRSTRAGSAGPAAPGASDASEAAPRVRTPRPSDDGVLVWEVGGTPVAFAAARPPTAAMSRIGPVYTAPEHRGHGYGSAVTAAASAWARQAGAREVVLYTDLANPASNAIYPRLGYRPVEDFVELGPG